MAPVIDVDHEAFEDVTNERSESDDEQRLRCGALKGMPQTVDRRQRTH